MALVAGAVLAIGAIAAVGPASRSGPVARLLSMAGAVRQDVSPPPNLTPLLGEQHWYKLLKTQVSDRIELEVNVANGNLEVHQKDLKIKGTGLDLKVEQHYNSLASTHGSVGNRWVLDTGADVHLTFPGGGAVIYYAPSGFGDSFLPLTGGGYSQPPGLDATLVKNSSGTYTLTFHQSSERYNFSADGRLASDVDKNGNTISFAYDSSGHLASVTDTQGRKTSFSSTSAGLIASIGDPASRTYSFAYDASGNLVSYTDPSGGVAHFAYDASSNLTQLTDPDGHVVRLTYDSSQRVTSSELVSNSSTGAGATTTYAYSSPTTTVTDADGNKTTYTSDSGGRVTEVTDALGNSTKTTYTADDNEATQTDALGNVTTASYDSLNNPTTGQAATGAKGTGAYADSSHPYDATTVTDTASNATKYTYDAAGDLIQVTDALSHVTKYAYNANGTQSSTTDANGNVTTYQYDSAGNLTGIFPTGLDYTYDAVSRVATTTDAKSQVTTYTYDALDRKLKVAYSDNTATTQTFDADGNRTQLVDSTGTTTFAYDALGRLVTKTLPSGEAITLGYDGDGNLTSRHDAGGTTTYTYNTVGLLASAKDPTGATTTFAYDAAHQPTRIAYPNGVTVNRAHDGANDVTEITAVNSAGTTLLKRLYSYVNPANGQQTLQRYIVTDQAGAVTTYGYDALNRLLSAVVKSSAGTVTDSRSYTYDPTGNRLSQTINGSTVNYTYDLQHGTITAGSLVYTYDADGNLAKRSDGYTWSYDAANFTSDLTFTTGNTCTPGPGIVCPAIVTAILEYPMTYSGLDQTQRVTADVNTFVYDPTGLTRITSGSTSTYELRDPNRHLISERSSSGTSYVIADALDSTIGLTASNGSLAATFTYDPWGNVIGQTGNVSTPFLFQGGYSDFGGVYKMSDRYYDPGTGRYLQVDNNQGSTADPQTLNRYVFQLNNPVNNPTIQQEQSATG